MSTETLPKRTGRITAEFFNTLKSVLALDLVPRSDGGVATHKAGSIGLLGIKWLRAYIASGHWDCGDIKEHNTYNGKNPIGHGWMLADGRTVTQANYDAEHGAGAWATYINASPLLNKYLPDYTNKFAIMQSSDVAASHNGNTGFPTIGNANNQVAVTHTHVHLVRPNYFESPYTFSDAAGNYQLLNIAFKDTDDEGYPAAGGLAVGYTGTHAVLVGGGLTIQYCTNTVTQNISVLPDSIGAQYYVRII